MAQLRNFEFEAPRFTDLAAKDEVSEIHLLEWDEWFNEHHPHLHLGLSQRSRGGTQAQPANAFESVGIFAKVRASSPKPGMSSIPPLKLIKGATNVVSPNVRIKKTPQSNFSRSLQHSRSITTNASSSRSSKEDATPYRTPKQRRDSNLSTNSAHHQERNLGHYVLAQLQQSPRAMHKKRLSNQSEFSNRSENFIQRNIERVKAMSQRKKTPTPKENRQQQQQLFQKLLSSSRKQILK